MSVLRCRPLALLMLAVFLAGCTAWRPTTIAPPQVVEEEEPSRVRVTRWSGERVTMSNPQVRADSIIGDEAGVALANVREMEVRRPSIARSLLLVLVAGGIFHGLVADGRQPESSDNGFAGLPG